LSRLGLAARFLVTAPRRVRLSFTMFCAASFVISSVALFRSAEPAINAGEKGGPTGGFTYRLTSPVAYRNDLSTARGRESLGLPAALPPGVRICSLLSSRGAEGGCLNLAAPAEMQVFGVGHDWVQRGGFDVKTNPETGNPWELLEKSPADGEPVPVFGDEETMQWIAYRQLGDVFEMPIDGRPVRLQLVGMIRGGLFSGQLLMSQGNLRKLAPGSTGYGVHFVETGTGQSLRPLSTFVGLFEYGFVLELTTRIIESVRSVQRLYMSMFLVLGALGLLLGAAGTAAVLVRDAAVRRGELATLQAVGLSRSMAAATLAVSHLTPVLLGLLAGSAAALIAYLAFAREMSLRDPLVIAAAIGIFACVVVAAIARLLQPRRLADALRSV
jgi:hypothetical protein